MNQNSKPGVVKGPLDHIFDDYLNKPSETVTASSQETATLIPNSQPPFVTARKTHNVPPARRDAQETDTDIIPCSQPPLDTRRGHPCAKNIDKAMDESFQVGLLIF